MKKRILKIVAATLTAALLVGTCSALSACDGYCQHVLETHFREDSTCMMQGQVMHYECVKCHKLFRYNDEDGLYEIFEADTMPFGGHTLGEFEGEQTITPRLKEGKEVATAFTDYDLYGHCSACGEYFLIPDSNLVQYCPPNNGGKHVEYDGFISTRYTFGAGTTAGTAKTITHSDSGSSPLANYLVPFQMNVPRYLLLVAYNPNDFDFAIKYGPEYYGARPQVEVTVPAHGYAPFLLRYFFSTSDNAYHELYAMQNLAQAADIELGGWYYFDSKLSSVDILSGSVQTEYAAGETFDASGIVLLETYTDGTTRRISGEGCTTSVGDRPLTTEDTSVTVYFGKKSIEIPISIVESPNLAPRATLTASASLWDGSSWGVDKLVDGVKMQDGPTYGWAAGSFTTADSEAWVMLSFNKAITFNHVNLYPREEGEYFPEDYVIEISDDGINFTAIHTVTGDADSIAQNAVVRSIRLPQDYTAKYVRIRATKQSRGGSGYYCEMTEIEIYRYDDAKEGK